MRKLYEKEDLSRKVLEVNIDSPVFQPILDKFNEQIIEVIRQVYNEEFESGDVTLKLTLSVPKLTKRFPVDEGFNNPKYESYEYKALRFKHNVTTTLKKVDKDDGSYYGEKELEKDDEGNFIEKPIEDPQLNMFRD
jgi:hypothetical protein